METISVIIPVYNAEKYLERCIDSVLAQDYSNLEIILINDGSSDNSGRICDVYQSKDSRIRVIHKKNGGAASARNCGLEIASGEYIGFVDSDDWITEDMYKYLVELLEDTQSDVTAIRCVLADKPMYVKQKEVTYQCFDGNEIIHDFLFQGACSSVGSYSLCCNLFKKSLFTGLRLPEGKIGEDIAIQYEILQRASRMVKSNKAGYFYFQGEQSVSVGGLKQNYADLLEAYKQLYVFALDSGIVENVYLAEVIRKRASFSILAKIAYYGIADTCLDRKRIIAEHTKILRSKYSFLMRSPIALNRKLMISVLCIHFNLLRWPLAVYRFLVNK